MHDETKRTAHYFPGLSWVTALWHRTPVAAVVVSSGGSVVAANPEFCALIGVTSDQTYRRVWRDFVDTRFHADVDEALDASVSSTPVQPTRKHTLVGAVFRVDRSLVWCYISCAAIIDDDGPPAGAVLHFIPMSSADDSNAVVEVGNGRVTVRHTITWMDIVRDNPRLFMAVALALGAVLGGEQVLNLLKLIF